MQRNSFVLPNSANPDDMLLFMACLMDLHCLEMFQYGELYMNRLSTFLPESFDDIEFENETGHVFALQTILSALYSRIWTVKLRPESRTLS